MRLTAPWSGSAATRRSRTGSSTAAIALGSSALRAVASGALDLANSRYRRVSVGVDLLRPPALFPNMTRPQRAA